MKTCMMTMGEYGNYFKCGKRARFVLIETASGRELNVCGVHAAALRKRGRIAVPIAEPPLPAPAKGEK